jgi:predicted nucleotide-binding protein
MKSVTSQSRRLRREDGDVELHAQIEKAKSLLAAPPISQAKLGAWEAQTLGLLEATFGPGSPVVQGFGTAPGFNVGACDVNTAWVDHQRAARLQRLVHDLEALLESVTVKVHTDTSETLQSTKSLNRVFLVHGHADGIVNEVARFLERLGLGVVVLREQPNLSQTIIEKFEEHADVRFAVVLLYGDDRGGLATESPETYQLRPRQNVVLELGYFMGRLGRSRVCVLRAANVELPSDYAGVGCVNLDDRAGWQFALARELEAAELEIDLARAISREA